jgi:hypothetical protein
LPYHVGEAFERTSLLWCQILSGLQNLFEPSLPCGRVDVRANTTQMLSLRFVALSRADETGVKHFRFTLAASFAFQGLAP